MKDHSLHDMQHKPFWGSRYSIGLLVMGAVALYFLLTEHRAHFFAAFPFLLLLSCPLIHIFMHHGHGGHGGSHDPPHDSEKAAPEKLPPARPAGGTS